jgi:hypothetical protein
MPLTSLTSYGRESAEGPRRSVGGLLHAIVAAGQAASSRVVLEEPVAGSATMSRIRLDLSAAEPKAGANGRFPLAGIQMARTTFVRNRQLLTAASSPEKIRTQRRGEDHPHRPPTPHRGKHRGRRTRRGLTPLPGGTHRPAKPRPLTTNTEWNLENAGAVRRAGVTILLLLFTIEEVL